MKYVAWDHPSTTKSKIMSATRTELMQYFFSRPQRAIELKMKLRMCMTKNIQQTTVID